MLRLAKALKSQNCFPIILSPATSMRARSRETWVHKEEVRYAGNIRVVFAGALSFRFIGFVTSIIFLLQSISRIRSEGEIAKVMMYNFNPTLVFLGIYLRLVLRKNIYLNVEDVYLPRWSDWRRDTDANPVQQIVFFICMHLIARMSSGYVLPTERFLAYLPKNKPFVVVAGCINVLPLLQNKRTITKLNVLFAGKIEFEHGVHVLVDAITLLDSNTVTPNIKFNICGTGSKSDWLHSKCEALTNVEVEYHGFVTNEKYSELLHAAHLCIALQDPNGRYLDFKTPSKVYEYLGYGKAVIATDVGDIRNIPSNAIDLCEPFNGAELANEIQLFLKDLSKIHCRSEHARAYAEANFSYRVVGHEICNLMLN